MIYVGIGLIIVGFVLIGKSPGLAFLLLAVGLVLDIIGIINRPKQKKRAASKPPVNTKNTENTIKPIETEKPKAEQPKSLWLSDMMGTAGLKYRYDNVPIVVTDAAPILSAAEREEWDLTARRAGDKVTLSTIDGEIGYMERFADMVGDWIRRKEPYRILLQNYNTETGKAVVYLAFYKEGFNPNDDDDEWIEDEEE